MALTPTQRIGGAVGLATLLAIPAEGLRQWAYADTGDVWTVCYGHTANVDRSRQYSLAECKALLDADMAKAVDIVDRCAPRLPLKMLAALGDLTFNVGSVAVCDRTQSTLARKLAAGDLVGTCEEIGRWNKARVAGVLVALPGLTKRRERERQLCLEGAYEL